jgi:hypothetical protein
MCIIMFFRRLNHFTLFHTTARKLIAGQKSTLLLSRKPRVRAEVTYFAYTALGILENQSRQFESSN